jgi:hypothetical protein
VTSDKKKPTKAELEIMGFLRKQHWKVWVTDREIARGRLNPGVPAGCPGYEWAPTDAQTRAARRACFRLRARGLTEAAGTFSPQGGYATGWAFRLTRAGREVLR